MGLLWLERVIGEGEGWELEDVETIELSGNSLNRDHSPVYHSPPTHNYRSDLLSVWASPWEVKVKPSLHLLSIGLIGQVIKGVRIGLRSPVRCL